MTPMARKKSSTKFEKHMDAYEREHGDAAGFDPGDPEKGIPPVDLANLPEPLASEIPKVDRFEDPYKGWEGKAKYAEATEPKIFEGVPPMFSRKELVAIHQALSFTDGEGCLHEPGPSASRGHEIMFCRELIAKAAKLAGVE